MKKVKLKSGRKLEVDAAPMEDSLNLHSAITEEGRGVPILLDDAKMNLMKNILFMMHSSKKIRDAVHACFPRCLYEGKRIIWPDTFEPPEGREDYSEICAEVAKENIAPFWKALTAQFSDIEAGFAAFLGSKLPTGSSSATSGSSEQATAR